DRIRGAVYQCWRNAQLTCCEHKASDRINECPMAQAEEGSTSGVDKRKEEQQAQGTGWCHASTEHDADKGHNRTHQACAEEDDAHQKREAHADLKQPKGMCQIPTHPPLPFLPIRYSAQQESLAGSL